MLTVSQILMSLPIGVDSRKHKNLLSYYVQLEPPKKGSRLKMRGEKRQEITIKEFHLEIFLF